MKTLLSNYLLPIKILKRNAILSSFVHMVMCILTHQVPLVTYINKLLQNEIMRTVNLKTISILFQFYEL